MYAGAVIEIVGAGRGHASHCLIMLSQLFSTFVCNRFQFFFFWGGASEYVLWLLAQHKDSGSVNG
jgi:hypothetical protein